MLVEAIVLRSFHLRVEPVKQGRQSKYWRRNCRSAMKTVYDSAIGAGPLVPERTRAIIVDLVDMRRSQALRTPLVRPCREEEGGERTVDQGLVAADIATSSLTSSLTSNSVHLGSFSCPRLNLSQKATLPSHASAGRCMQQLGGFEHILRTSSMAAEQDSYRMHLGFAIQEHHKLEEGQALLKRQSRARLES